MKLLLTRFDGLLVDSIEIEGVESVTLQDNCAVIQFTDKDAYDEAYKRTAWTPWDDDGGMLEMPLLSTNCTTVVYNEYTVEIR